MLLQSSHCLIPVCQKELLGIASSWPSAHVLLLQSIWQVSLLACSWRSLVGRLKIFYDNHWKQAVQDVMGIPVKLHSPTFSQLAWRAAIVFMVTVVLMGVVCTMDKGFAAATAYCIQQVRTVNAGIAAAVAHCTQQRDKYVAVAVAYCMEKVHRKGFAAALFLYGPGVLLS